MVLPALLSCLSVVTCHAFVVLNPVVDVFVNFALEGRWNSRGDGQVNDGGGSGRSLRRLVAHPRLRKLVVCAFTGSRLNSRSKS